MTLSDEDMRSQLNSFGPPISQLLGQEVLKISQTDGTSRLKFLARAEFCNPIGHVQGGIVAAMLDAAAAIACIAKGRGRIIPPTLEFKVSFYAPASPGVLVANGYCRKLGRTIAFLEAELLDASDKKLATMTATCIPTPMPDTPHQIPRTYS